MSHMTKRLLHLYRANIENANCTSLEAMSTSVEELKHHSSSVESSGVTGKSRTAAVEI